MSQISYRLLTLVLLLGLLGSGCGKPSPVQALRVGDKAADFSLSDVSGRFLKLSDTAPGNYLVLFFYRGAWCDTCVSHLQHFKRDFAKFSEMHASLAAISVDTVEVSAALNEQWRFPFPLLSDQQLRLIDAYGARDPKGGHKGEDISHVGVVIIDPQGIVRYKYIGDKAWDLPATDEVLFNLQKIESQGVYEPGGVS
ncbi:MAG TPA: redoxin domain-containing protein [bacterium]|jgi:peroxiredoxin|nr:redoxin domain-containing protein [bacterium]